MKKNTGEFPLIPLYLDNSWTVINIQVGYFIYGGFKEYLIVFRDYKGVSENNGTSKSSILIGFSIINHPFWGALILGTPP